MSALGIASIVFVCIFCSGLLGLFLRTVVPKHHLGEDSRGVVKLGSELLATFAAIVLGLLIASAKDSYDKTNDEVTQTPTKVAQFDRDLAHYGPETKETRNLLHDVFAFAIEPTFSEKGSEEKLNNPDRRARVAQLQAKLLELAPRTDAQRSLQAHALKLINELAEMHWLVIMQGDGMTPMPSLVVLVLWLAIIFAGFGLVTAKNATVVVILLVWALPVSGAILMIEEMNRPLEGLMKISGAPLRNALTHLGQ